MALIPAATALAMVEGGINSTAYSGASVTNSGTTITITISGGHTIPSGAMITVSGVTGFTTNNSAVNGLYQVTSVTATTVVYTASAAPTGSGAGTIVVNQTYYASLHTATTSTTGAAEITEARQPVIFVTNGSTGIQSTAGINFTSMPAEAGGVPFLGLWNCTASQASANSGGTFIGGFTTSGLSGAVTSGATIAFASAQITAAVTG